MQQGLRGCSGVAVCTIRLANNRRWTGRDGQETEETTYINVNLWREMAENVAETFSKGDRAIAIGRLLLGRPVTGMQQEPAGEDDDPTPG